MNNITHHANSRIEQRRSDFAGDFSLLEIKQIVSKCAASITSSKRAMVNCYCEGVLVAKIIAASGTAITVLDASLRNDFGQCTDHNSINVEVEV